jgi:hypothetical protein
MHPMLPASKADYYRSVEAKHFDRDCAVGSVFTDPSAGSLVELIDYVETTRRRRGGLTGDDRDELIALGADPDAFAPVESGIRYLKTVAGGKLGIVRAADLDPNTPVIAVRAKEGVPCALVAQSDVPRPKVDFGTVIVGPDPDGSGEDIVFTAHPGAPIRPAADDRYYAGQRLSAADAVANHGDGVYLQLNSL